MIARLEAPPAPLSGSHVRLEPLTVEHVPGLVAAASVDRSTFALTTVPEGGKAMLAYVQVALALARVGAAAPFATVDARTGEVVGSTRFANLEHVQTYSSAVHTDIPSAVPNVGPLVRGSAVEIGWTWLTPAAQRTGINTEAKLLMLRHAFEVWGLQRVVLKTNEQNVRSRTAIERLGAKLDGVLCGYLPNGETRKAAYYSLVAADWPATRQKLKLALAHHVERRPMR